MDLKTADLCDACEDAVACELPFLSFGKRRAFAGSIRTVRYKQGLSALRELVHQPGDNQVLVIDGAGLVSRALFGDVMAGIAVHNRWAGIIVNGLIRDRAEIDEMDLGVKALGTAPKRPNISGGGECDIPVTFGGVTFRPGLRLVADLDGVIVLPEGVTESSISVADVIEATAAYAARVGPNHAR